MKIEIKDDIKETNKRFEYSLKFSDNPYTMIFKGSILECNYKKAIMDNRIHLFFTNKTKELKTSDIGFKYKRT